MQKSRIEGGPETQTREERRKGKPQPPLFAELLLEADWRPSDCAPTEGDGWFRAHGHALDRRRA